MADDTQRQNGRATPSARISEQRADEMIHVLHYIERERWPEQQNGEYIGILAAMVRELLWAVRLLQHDGGFRG